MNFKNRNQLFLSECFTQHYKKKEKGVVFLETDVVNTLNARTSKRACKTIGFPQNHTSRSKLKIFSDKNTPRYLKHVKLCTLLSRSCP